MGQSPAKGISSMNSDSQWANLLEEKHVGDLNLNFEQVRTAQSGMLIL